MSLDELMQRAEARGVRFARREGHWIITGIRRLSPRQQAELRAALAAASPSRPTRPAAEPEPEWYVGGRRVTEAHVFEMLEDFGEVQAYRDGRISKAEAYRRARNWLRNRAEMRGARVHRSPFRRDS